MNPQILFLCAGDPENPRTFSGSAGRLLAALETRGAIAGAANILGHADAFQSGGLPARVLRFVDRRLQRLGTAPLEAGYRWSRRAFRRNSRSARQQASSVPAYNACFMYGTTFWPELNVPTYCYFDATVQQAAQAKQWEFATLPERVVEEAAALQRQVFEQCTAILPRSRWAAGSVIADYGISEELVIPVGAGPNHDATAFEHGPYDRRTILFVGTEFARKGGPLLLRAFKRVRRALPDARLVIVGCAPEVDMPGVEIVGHIDKHAPGGLEKLLHFYSQASLFCTMSTFEPFGIVALEAQASGVPCVAPDAFAFPETIRDGVTGRLAPVNADAETLADLLESLLKDPPSLRRMGEAAQRFVSKEWTWDAAAERILARIEADLAAGAAPPADG